MKKAMIIIILAGLVGLAIADNLDQAASWTRIAQEWDIKVKQLQNLKDYWQTHSDSIVVQIQNDQWNHQPGAKIKWKTNADFRNAVNDSITAYKAHREAAKDSSKAYLNPEDGK